MFQVKFVEKIKTHFRFNKIFPRILLFMTTLKNTVDSDRPLTTF